MSVPSIHSSSSAYQVPMWTGWTKCVILCTFLCTVTVLFLYWASVIVCFVLGGGVIKFYLIWIFLFALHLRGDEQRRRAVAVAHVGPGRARQEAPGPGHWRPGAASPAPLPPSSPPAPPSSGCLSRWAGLGRSVTWNRSSRSVRVFDVETVPGGRVGTATHLPLPIQTLPPRQSCPHLMFPERNLREKSIMGGEPGGFETSGTWALSSKAVALKWGGGGPESGTHFHWVTSLWLDKKSFCSVLLFWRGNIDFFPCWFGSFFAFLDFHQWRLFICRDPEELPRRRDLIVVSLISVQYKCSI